MRPEATLATTSGHFSSDEASYADDIKQAAKKNAWRVHFGLLDNPGAPSVAEILGIAEAAVHTSIQEGFGMGFVEAAAAGTPLIARAIPDVMPDLNMLGFEFPQIYADIFIAPELFDKATKTQHQANLFHEAKLALPTTFQDICQRSLQNAPPVVTSKCTTFDGCFFRFFGFVLARGFSVPLRGGVRGTVVPWLW